MIKARSTVLATCITTAFAPLAAQGAGFGLIQHSAKSGGTAYAGTGVNASDPATVFFNPAGMVRNEGQILSAGVSRVDASFDFEDEGSTYPAPELLGADTGQTSVESREQGYPPKLYYINRFRDDWAAGIAVNAPFGSRTDYDDDWVGRYHGIESEIISININPNVAYRINDRVSVGMGFSAQYFEATLSSKVPNADPAQGPVFNPATDSELEISGDSWAAGVNAGLLADVTDNTQIGLSWRSVVAHRIKGDATFTDPEGNREVSGGGASIRLPDTYTLSLRHEPDFEERLAILADASYMRWNRVDDIEVDFDEPVADGQIDGAILPLNFRDSWRGSLGLTWDQNEQLQLRTGFMFDHSAVRDSESRTPRVPDNHRRWISLGAGWVFQNGLELDASYSHVMVNDTRIDNLDEATGAQLTGTFDSSADIASLQATYRF